MTSFFITLSFISCFESPSSLRRPSERFVHPVKLEIFPDKSPQGEGVILLFILLEILIIIKDAIVDDDEYGIESTHCE